MTMTFAEPSGRWGRATGSARLAEAITEPVNFMRPTVSPPSTAMAPQWYAPTVSRILELLSLGPNWDDRGSAPVSLDALAFAFSILSQAMSPRALPPSIIPLGHGGVQLVWSSPDTELEVEVIRPNEIIGYYLDKRTGKDHEWSATTEFSDLADIIAIKFSA